MLPGDGMDGRSRTRRLGREEGTVVGVNVTDAIIAYEQGDLDDDAVVDLFQDLVDSGAAWRLQGHYGRTAIALIQAGLVSPPERNRA